MEDDRQGSQYQSRLIYRLLLPTRRGVRRIRQAGPAKL
jgi:hypothetical protein